MQWFFRLLLFMLRFGFCSYAEKKLVSKDDFFARNHLRLVGLKTCDIVIGIDYSDGKDEHKLHKVRITRIAAYDAGWVYLDAYCFTAKAQRTFRVDRINSFVDADGAYIPPRTYLIDVLKVPLLKKEMRMRDRSTYGR